MSGSDITLSRLSPISAWSPWASRGRSISVIGMVSAIALVLMAAVNLADLRSEEQSVKLGLDAQVMAKLAIVSALGVFGFYMWLSSGRVRFVLGTIPLAWLVLAIAVFCAVVPTALDARAAMVSSGSMLVCLLAVVGMAVRSGPSHVAWLLFFGQILFLAGSWFVYFWMPGKGVFLEPIADGQFVKRMAGLAHPNTLGLYAALTMVVGLGLWPQLRASSPDRWRGREGAMAAALVMALLTLVLSLSRTAAAALVITLLVVYRHKWMRGTGLLLSMVAVGIGLAAMWILAVRGDLERLTSDKIGSLLTKSSDAEELKSLTGRSLIWAQTIKLIAERPLTGYGAASSKELLRDYMSYAHNTWLHVGLSAGAFAMGALVLAVVAYFITMVQRPAGLPDAVFILLIANGMTENVGFEYIAAAPMAWWVLVMAWRPCDRLQHDSSSEGAA